MTIFEYLNHKISFVDSYLESSDQHSDLGVPHRALSHSTNPPGLLSDLIKPFIIEHHASPSMLARAKIRSEALKKLGQNDSRVLFPSSDKTRKGNWGEIFLAEYLKSSSSSDVPVYRLRFNPNVDQSMKGDDVLAFDLDSDPVRVLVGEAKFRSSPSITAVQQMIAGLEKSFKAGVPTSLNFVVDRLFLDGRDELAAKVDNCSLLFAQEKLELDYVGLLVSSCKGQDYVNKNATSSTLRNLLVISLNVDNPADLIDQSFSELNEV